MQIHQPDLFPVFVWDDSDDFPSHPTSDIQASFREYRQPSEMPNDQNHGSQTANLTYTRQ